MNSKHVIKFQRKHCKRIFMMFPSMKGIAFNLCKMMILLANRLIYWHSFQNVNCISFQRDQVPHTILEYQIFKLDLPYSNFFWDLMVKHLLHYGKLKDRLTTIQPGSLFMRFPILMQGQFWYLIWDLSRIIGCVSLLLTLWDQVITVLLVGSSRLRRPHRTFLLTMSLFVLSILLLWELAGLWVYVFLIKHKKW